jgi:hypothetical protein
MIENLGNLGDFIGGIGVVVTLIYLATQIRQNTRSLRLSSLQQIMGTSVSINETSSIGPIPEILAKLELHERLDEKEFARYLMYIWAMLTHHWQVFYQYQNGMIDQEVFNAYVARLRIVLNTSLSRGMWRTRMRKSFPKDFQEFIDAQIEDHAQQIAEVAIG